MKREILFRGYNVKRNIWLTGSYIINKGVTFIAPDEFAEGMDWSDYEVVMSSVGQSSELRNSKGTPIFDGDIVKIRGRLYVVVFYEGYFGVVTIKQYDLMKNGCHPFLNDYAHLDLLIDMVMSEPIEKVGVVYEYEKKQKRS